MSKKPNGKAVLHSDSSAKADEVLFFRDATNKLLGVIDKKNSWELNKTKKNRSHFRFVCATHTLLSQTFKVFFSRRRLILKSKELMN
ncbi:hypothetical protein Bca4012_026567 [Brassica carinata]